MILPQINLGRYAPGRSLLHRADPRTKIILALLFIALLYGVESYPAFLLLLLFILTLAVQAGRPLTHTLRGLRPIFFLAAFAVLFNIFWVTGTPVATSGIFRHISWEGLNFSAKMVLRLLLLVSSASLLTLTTTPLALTDGLERLLKPFKRIGIPVQQLTMMMALALRFIPVIVEEAQRIIIAQSSRSAAFNSGNLCQRLQSYMPLLLPLFAGIFRRGEALVTAMESRCYRSDRERTRMRPLKFSAADLLSSAVMLLLLLVIFWVEYRYL